MYSLVVFNSYFTVTNDEMLYKQFVKQLYLFLNISCYCIMVIQVTLINELCSIYLFTPIIYNSNLPFAQFYKHQLKLFK